MSGRASSSQTGLARQDHCQCVSPSHSASSHPHKVPGSGAAFQQASSTSLQNGPFQVGSMLRLRVRSVQFSPWLQPTPGHSSPSPSAHVPGGPRPPTRREADAVPVLELQPALAELALAFLHPRLLLAQLVDDDVELASQDVDLPLGQLLLAASQQLLLVLLLQRSPRQLLLPGAELLGAAGPRTMSKRGCQYREVRPESLEAGAQGHLQSTPLTGAPYIQSPAETAAPQLAGEQTSDRLDGGERQAQNSQTEDTARGAGVPSGSLTLD